MELQIKPYHKNNFPVKGLLIKGSSITSWLKELQLMCIEPSDVKIYPIPGNTPNSIWGSLVLEKKPNTKKHLDHKHQRCQQVRPNIYIPENSRLYPVLSAQELNELFSASIHLIHPILGFIELSEPLNIEDLIAMPDMRSYYVSRPQAPLFVPQRVIGFRLGEVDPDDKMKDLEENIFPQKGKMESNPLNIAEKGKLFFYRSLFKKSKEANDKPNIEKTDFGKRVNTFLKRFFNTEKIERKLITDYEQLEKRNMKTLDKLLDMLKNDPTEALKYAIPLDSNNSLRSSNSTSSGQWELSKIWGNLSWLSNRGHGGSGQGIDLGDGFYSLQRQYHDTAERLIKENKHKEAAFIYMKLLKNPHRAAEILEQGKHYEEAATIYLKHTQNKQKAAYCYEQANLTTNAINLYIELKEHEKVGDIYTSISKTEEANVHYKIAADELLSQYQHVKCAALYSQKMHDIDQARVILKDGWKLNRDASNCLTKYFDSFSEINSLRPEIHQVYNNELTEYNCSAFLEAIKNERPRNKELSNEIKEIAYQTIAKYIHKNSFLINNLRQFNPEDEQLIKDTLRYKVKNRNYS